MDIPQALVEQLRSAQQVAVLSGAGISAESGVPTFREAQTGLWARYRAEELATPQAFRQNPTLVWEWYTWRRGLVDTAQPNPGHLALVEMEAQIEEFTLITQNVDGLHQRAGSGRRSPVIELHGNIHRTICFDERTLALDWDQGGDAPPRCLNCGGYLRPDVVWFGESLPAEALEAAWEATRACEIFFSVGTSTMVEPAASLPFIAAESGAIVVEINPQPTPFTQRATYVIPEASGAALPALVRAAWPDSQSRRGIEPLTR